MTCKQLFSVDKASPRQATIRAALGSITIESRRLFYEFFFQVFHRGELLGCVVALDIQNVCAQIQLLKISEKSVSTCGFHTTGIVQPHRKAANTDAYKRPIYSYRILNYQLLIVVNIVVAQIQYNIKMSWNVTQNFQKNYINLANTEKVVVNESFYTFTKLCT